MAKNNMKPRIRFKGFTDAWEQRKLGEYFIERNERSGEGELISVTINAGIKKFNELGRFDTKPEDLSKYKRVEVGDIAYNSMRMWQGASGYSSYSGILSPAYTVISPKTGVSSLFFAYLIKRPQMIHLFEINSQGLTSDTWNLKFPAFSKIEASAPSDIDEQENISELFTVLDNLITLHQCKLSRFFSIKNTSFSCRTRAEDTFAWEQRKLGEAANIYDGVHQTPDYKDSGIMFLSVENISTLKSGKYISEEAFTRDYKVYPQKGDILMTRIGDVGTPNVVESTEKLAFYVSLALLKPINVDSYFLCNSILSPLFQRGLKERTLVTAIPQKINKDEIGKVSFFVPNSRDEQKQIGTFFANLDNLITLHQRGEKYITGDEHDKRHKTK